MTSYKDKKLFRKLCNIVVDIVFWGCILVLVYIAGLIFLFASFSVRSGSMHPTLMGGDVVFVWKPILGARLFNIFDALDGKQVTVRRLPGLRKIRHNDVLVFHIPYPKSSGQMEMHLLKYYVKRCVGLPGDTIEVRDGFYHVGSAALPPGNVESQQRLSGRDSASFSKEMYLTFPHDSVLQWNILHFGPMYIPAKGDVLPMNRTNFVLYGKLVEWERQATLTFRNDTVFMDGRPLSSYSFEKNYYFMAGDWTEDSQDSRYWGLAPEEYIVGKAPIIWKSKDPHTGKMRWERVFKQ
ncbi:MAG: signal peptidase I, partial [Tannerella sp.]|nr:signal peptidase I [Tannerella sp.]